MKKYFELITSLIVLILSPLAVEYFLGLGILAEWGVEINSTWLDIVFGIVKLFSLLAHVFLIIECLQSVFKLFPKLFGATEEK